MANPISDIKRLEIPAEDVEKNNLDELTKAVSENKEACIKGIGLLSAMNESGILDAASALIKHRKEATKNVVQELNKPQYSATLENLVELFLLLGEIDVNEVSNITDKINHGMKEAMEVPPSSQEKMNYIGMIKALKDPEINKSITMILSFLKGMGKEL
ncbi:DUF1641 domain-containing protein [Virgibacillus sp. SK37]|uniref:DUF1641 domain-containing protein n=1 Tax=Virgibacillus sp. SK37 TaxID=403957 RepID=UPI0004D1E657|nr:DUF1641 domain-containing protein [Virgibacillus sp. SK37]AIF43943.1 hypothetical protein X953_12930 [Virgibacillus sp. SK37]